MGREGRARKRRGGERNREKKGKRGRRVGEKKGGVTRELETIRNERIYGWHTADTRERKRE